MRRAFSSFSQRRATASSFIINLSKIRPQSNLPASVPVCSATHIHTVRIYSHTAVRLQDGKAAQKNAKELSRQGLENTESNDAEKKDSSKQNEVGYDGQLDEKLGDHGEKMSRTPWHREGADEPPVKRLRQAGAMTKGKLLTTPSRLLKLILPLTTLDKNTDRKDIEPLALLVHPQQPLSYLERLIQFELPLIQGKDGKDKVPTVHFRAEDSPEPEVASAHKGEGEEEQEEEGSEEMRINGKKVKTGKINKEVVEEAKVGQKLRGGPGEGGVETYSGLGHESKESKEPSKFVRWSSSTEIGDFIRDAARGKEFAVEIEGAGKEIRVGVPSFNDRTHYLRIRLRKTSKKLESLASIKKECDHLAHKSAQRLAMSGFGVLVAWWGGTYYFTFLTPYGWDTMEPITYLAGLSTIMLGYVYFLWHNREVSYRAALHLTVSHRQNQLYAAKGFDVHRWESLIDEANALRKEVKLIAEEYDVDWDEKQDEGSEIVHQALRQERKKSEKKKDSSEDEDVEDEEKDSGGGKEADDVGGDEGKGKEKVRKHD